MAGAMGQWYFKEKVTLLAAITQIIWGLGLSTFLLAPRQAKYLDLWFT